MSINYHIKWCRISSINSRWWLNHPIEEYVRQTGSFPQIPVKIPKTQLKPPPSVLSTLPKFNSSPLKNHGWKTNLAFWGRLKTSGAFAVKLPLSTCFFSKLPPWKHHKNRWIIIMIKFEASVKMMSKIFPKRDIWGFWLSLMCPPGATNHSK